MENILCSTVAIKSILNELTKFYKKVVSNGIDTTQLGRE